MDSKRATLMAHRGHQVNTSRRNTLADASAALDQYSFKHDNFGHGTDRQEKQLWWAYMDRKLASKLLEPNIFGNVEPFYSRWFRFIMTYLIKLAQVNAAGSKGFGPSVERHELPLWSKLVELYIVYFSIRMTICLVAQHNYDRLSYMMQATMVQSSWNETNNNNNLTLDSFQPHDRQQLAIQLKRSIERLDLVGSPWRELEFPVEGAYFCYLVFYNLIYFGPRLVQYKGGPLSLSFIRFILNPEKEHMSIQMDIRELANDFLVSSENYLHLCRQVKSKVSHRFLALDSGRDGAFIGNCRKFNEDITHSALVCDVSKLVLSGRLVPLNRSQIWLHKVELLACSLMLFMFLFEGSFIMFFGLACPYFVVPGFHFHTSPGDLWLFAEMVLATQIGLLLVSFYFLWLVSIVIDQVKFANELTKLIRQTSSKVVWFVCNSNASTSDHASTTSTGNGINSIRSLHVDIITILVQLKLFRRQLAASRRAKGTALSYIIMIMATAPILERALVAHMNDRTKLMAVIGALIIISLADSVVWPSCHLYSRCLGIQRGLSSLLAHLVSVTHYGGQDLTASWLSSGITSSQWLLRTDLKQPEVMMDKFATRTLFGKLTYYNSIGVHFWCGIVLLSLWLRGTNSTGNPLIDSLWIF